MVSLALVCLVVAAPDAEPISFNDQIRPILADRCFACHGPDSVQRKAELRLDQEEGAMGVLVPTKPDESELLQRISSHDPDEVMPPPTSKLKLADSEIALIRKWIEQGAPWERHWSFVPPEKQERPAVNNHAWPIDDIDYFILRRLEAEGVQPAQPASRERWLRRVTFDLTGLPPTIEELDAFLSDKSDNAYETVVDRLLKSTAFGERLALDWLDTARYGDTDGLFEDHPRAIYPWRDWVVEAFNSNLPYNDFITWQLAGDLLPNATTPQRIATGFLRNNPTSNEGGIIDEDYRIKYLVDRVNTTATAMLGLTLECAQCHDHKYDPMTQREYYQFAGFFNNLAGKGNTKGATAPTLRNYNATQEERLKSLGAELAQLDTTLKSTPAALTQEFEQWLKQLDEPIEWAAPSLVENESVKSTETWLVRNSKEPITPPADNDKAMPGRYVRLALKSGQTGFLTISEVEVFVGKNNVARSGKATQSSVGYNSPGAKAINGNRDGSFASCSCTNEEKDAWWEVDLGDMFPIDSVAVWNRSDCCPERLDNISVQILDESRKVVSERILGKAEKRNALPADAKDVSPKQPMLTFEIESPLATIAALQWESELPNIIEVTSAKLVQAGKTVDVKLSGNSKLKLNKQPQLLALAEPLAISDVETLQLTIRTTNEAGFRVTVSDNPTAALRATLPKEGDKRKSYFRNQWPGFAEARTMQKQLTDEKGEIDAAAPLTMVASDLPSPRANHMLIRGEYDRRGDLVETAALSSIMAFADELPRNRTGLARWLTDSNNPLTSRVAVNRYWQMLFGIGLVKTSEDFGTQGERASHPALLDSLAVDFSNSGGDIKALIRRIVLSSTYRQTSRQSVAILARDPDNRLLSHATRRRLEAEFIRDHALATSGLLVTKLGGPGVNPYQPGELFGRNAIGSANSKFTQGSGDALYRRSLYTYWKRQIPAANMRILGADGRTKCRTRRERTNTPLQALVLLNDPQFVEAARVLADRTIRSGGDTPKQRLAFVFRLSTSRRPNERELEILLLEYTDRLQEFQADPEAAKMYLAGGGANKAAADLDAAELAAYAAVCSLILNLDESLSAS
jgi:hypothetical protein